MTILWAGNEDVDFVNSISDVSNTYIGNSVYSRSGIKTANKCVSAYFTPSSSLWLSYYSVQSTFTNIPNVLFRCTETNSMIGAGYSDGFAFYKGDDEHGFFLINKEETSSLGAPGTINRIDIRLLNYPTGSITAYVNGRITLSTTDLLHGAGGLINQIMINLFGTHQLFGLVVADEDTSDMYVATLSPNGTGVSNWVGSYADINEMQINSTSSVHTDIPNVLFSCNLSNLPALPHDVLAIAIAYQDIKGSDGLRIRHGFNTNLSLILSDPIDPFSFYASTNAIYSLNPTTNLPFTTEDANNLSLVFHSVNDSWQPDEIIGGFEITATEIPSMGVYIGTGSFRLGGIVYNLESTGNVYPINTAPSDGESRYDLFCIGIDGVIDYISGASAISPIYPVAQFGSSSEIDGPYPGVSEKHLKIGGYIHVRTSTVSILQGDIA